MAAHPPTHLSASTVRPSPSPKRALSQIAGTLGDGALIVESGENAKITLVLGGVSIKNSTGAAIQIATADDVTIELAEGTTNVLQSGEEVDIATATESEEASGGALQSKVDLKIKGKGSLTVLGYLDERHPAARKT